MAWGSFGGACLIRDPSPPPIMTDGEPIPSQLLDRYLAGDLPAAQRARVVAWLDANPTAAAVVRDLPRAALGDATSADTDRSWRAVSARLDASENGDQLAARRGSVATGSRPLWQRRAVRIAAALMLVVGGVATWRAATTQRGGALDAPLGRDVTATLPDGSRITLAAGSRVTWAAGYGAAHRDIVLAGEALFDVVHDASHPFRVLARDAVAEDIGTRFVVRAWPELAAVDVAVEEGVVALADTSRARAHRGAELRAGQRGRLAAGGVVVVSGDAESVLAWTRGHLVFDKDPLATVLPAISRRFNVELRADPALGARLLSARFAAQSLQDVLDALAVSLDVRVVTVGRTITLMPSSR